MRISKILQNSIGLSTLFLLVWSCSDDSASVQKSDVKVVVNINMEGEPLVLEDKIYENYGNDYIIEKFMMYLSNFTLYSSDNVAVFVENDSYHLIRASDGVVAFEFMLKDVPVGEYVQLSYGIGVDPATNTSIDNLGDLDPTNQMAWDWNIGYKFVLFEGRLTDSLSQESGLIYHIGYSENYFEQVEHLNVPLQVNLNGESNIEMTVEVSEMFKNPNMVNMAILNEVKFVKDHVDIIVENYKSGLVKVNN